MAPTFPGFPAQGLAFLRRLAKNNDRDWFRANKTTYAEHVRAPTLALIEALNARLARFAPEYVAEEPERAMPRIHRDVRFGRDKTPYRTSTAALFPRRGGPRRGTACFRAEVSPRGVEVVCGAYVLDAPHLAALRRHVADHAKRLERLVRRPKLLELMGRVQGERLVRAPRGWPADHPALGWLRYKQLYLRARLPAALARTPELVDEVARRFRAAAPLVAFLDEGAAAAAPTDR